MKKLTVLDAKGETTQAGFALRHKGHPVGITDKFLPFAHAFGARMLSPELDRAAGVAKNPDTVRGIQVFVHLVQRDTVVSPPPSGPQAALAQQRAAPVFRASRC